MAKETIVDSWNFNSATNRILITEEHIFRTPTGNSRVSKTFAFQLDEKTEFSKDIWDAWWNKQPIIVNHDKTVIPSFSDNKHTIQTFKAYNIKAR